MANRKSKSELTISFHLTIPRKLVRRMDKELAKTRKMLPYANISRSAFYSHVIGEYCAILDDPSFVPRPASVRVRTRPSRTRAPNPRPGPRLTPATVRKIRRDKRPATDVARDLGVHKSTVGRIRNGTTHRAVA